MSYETDWNSYKRRRLPGLNAAIRGVAKALYVKWGDKVENTRSSVRMDTVD